ncbi:MAG TPA: hypothetical protein VFR38_02765 [Gaiellaceae bacterium]|nr:hypothetical protein [Gaiellaceae bacterium]
MRRSAVVGLLAGALVGSTILVIVGSAIARSTADSDDPYVEAAHLPQLLTTAGAVELEYDAYCVDPATDEAESSCDVEGSAFVRSGASGYFRELRLLRDGATNRLVARVPESIASSPDGFTYYAEIETRPGGASVTLPAGGASAPHRSLPLGQAIQVDLGTHRFGEPTRAGERVAEAAWGDGPSEAGLEEGLNVPPIGASAFDVDASGTVVLLDQPHGRLLRWRHGARSATQVPLEIDGTLADMTLAPDGTVYVLESVGRGGRTPLVRRFDSDGRSLGSTDTAEGRSSQIRHSPGGPVVLQQPSQQWMPVAAGGSLVGPDGQRRSGRSGRLHGGGIEVIVLRHGNEIRIALARSAGVLRSWRITSHTALAEVQLAEPLGNDLVLVTRAYTDDRDRFLVLVLDRSGVRRTFALESAEWAETAPLARFRLVGSFLYQLGSTPAGVFVDRFDLEVK